MALLVPQVVPPVPNTPPDAQQLRGDLRRGHTGATIARFQAFLRTWGGASAAVRFGHTAWHVVLGSYRLSRWLGALFGALGQRRYFRYLQWKYPKPLSDQLWLFHWAVGELRSRYQPPEPGSAPTQKRTGA